MITFFFKVPHGQIPTAKIRLNTPMGDKDEYRLDIESAPPVPADDDGGRIKPLGHDDAEFGMKP